LLILITSLNSAICLTSKDHQ